MTVIRRMDTPEKILSNLRDLKNYFEKSHERNPGNRMEENRLFLASVIKDAAEQLDPQVLKGIWTAYEDTFKNQFNLAAPRAGGAAPASDRQLEALSTTLAEHIGQRAVDANIIKDRMHSLVRKAG